MVVVVYLSHVIISSDYVAWFVYDVQILVYLGTKGLVSYMLCDGSEDLERNV